MSVKPNPVQILFIFTLDDVCFIFAVNQQRANKEAVPAGIIAKLLHRNHNTLRYY